MLHDSRCTLAISLNSLQHKHSWLHEGEIPGSREIPSSHRPETSCVVVLSEHKLPPIFVRR